MISEILQVLGGRVAGLGGRVRHRHGRPAYQHQLEDEERGCGCVH